jgi:hypothetical protein
MGATTCSKLYNAIAAGLASGYQDVRAEKDARERLGIAEEGGVRWRNPTS